MDLKRQCYLVLGISKSGFAAANYILHTGGKCKIYEETNSDRVKEKISLLTEKGAVDVTKNETDAIMSGVDVVVLSPGIPINHKVAVEAKRQNIRIISEFEFGFESLFPRTVAVTGTNGKTTTVSLISHILKCADVKTSVVGNIGYPITEKIEEIKSADVCVAEVSSFQLESIYKFAPHIACVLNVSPDHLERHYNMENYIFLKKRLVKNLTQSEYAVLNFDDKTVAEFADETSGKIIPVSTLQNYGGAFMQGDKLYYKNREIIRTNEIPLTGKHNIYNTLFAIAVCSLLGVDTGTIKDGIKSFKGVKHRTEVVLEKNGIKYINDSKATNTASTITALSSMTQPTVLILGGSEKGEVYDELFKTIKSAPVRHVVITGASRINMLESAGKVGVGDLTVVKNFDDAVRIARKIACEGDAVLLSPACASFDSFSNYEERGDRFTRLAEEEL